MVRIRDRLCWDQVVWMERSCAVADLRKALRAATQLIRHQVARHRMAAQRPAILAEEEAQSIRCGDACEHATIAARHERMTDTAAIEAMDEVFEAYSDAILTGYTADIISLKEHLRSRRTRRWLLCCRALGPHADTRAGVHLPGGMSPPNGEGAVPAWLAVVDRAAQNLTAEDVKNAMNAACVSSGRDRDVIFAARLAVLCGAFGYRPTEYEKARKTFNKLARKRGSDNDGD